MNRGGVIPEGGEQTLAGGNHHHINIAAQRRVEISTSCRDKGALYIIIQNISQNTDQLGLITNKLTMTSYKVTALYCSSDLTY